MKKLFYFLVAIICIHAQADELSDNLNKINISGYEGEALKAENMKQKYSAYFFNEVLQPKTEFLGFIDPNFRRLKIFFTHIEKLSGDTYKVLGYSDVKGNKTKFTGTISIEQIREFKKMHFGCDDEYQNNGIKTQGILIGRYIFNEDRVQEYSGTFSGIMTARWYENAQGYLKYDDIESYSDGYKNNQYTGTWRMYGSYKHKTANWGEFRIPNSGNLDIGVAEFSSNSKYNDQGWRELSQNSED